MDLDRTIGEILRPKRIAVCTAWGSPFVWTHGAYNMMNLERPKDTEVRFFPGFGWCPARRHMDGVERALSWGATHVCFLGADQMHPTDILVKFSDHAANGWPVVAALVPCRGWVKSDKIDKPFIKIGWKWKDDNSNKTGDCYNTDYMKLVDPADGPYQEIVSTGSGALMFDVNLLGKMKKPWFTERVSDDDYNRTASMDTTFCYRLMVEGGARILCDLTIDIIHLDVFPIDESYGDRFKDWPKWKAQEALHKYL